MRNIAVKLTDLFGRTFNNEINLYLSTQWVRGSSFENCEFGLNDLDEDKLIRAIERLIKSADLKATQFLKHTMIRAFVNNRGAIAPLLAIKHTLYEELFSCVATVEAQLLYESYEFEYSGKGNHVTVTKRSTVSSGDSVGGYINGVTQDGDAFSLLINGEQWLEIINAYQTIKCNNTLFVDKEWDESVQKSFLYHRLIDEFAGSLLDKAANDIYQRYRTLVDIECAFYERDEATSEDIFTKRGYKIGTTVKLFADVKVIEAVNTNQSSIKDKMKVVVDNSKHKQKPHATSAYNADQVSDGDEVFEDWGGF